MQTCQNCDHLKINRKNKLFPCFCNFGMLEYALPCTIEAGIIQYGNKPIWCPLGSESWRKYQKQYIDKHYNGARDLGDLLSRSKKHASCKVREIK